MDIINNKGENIGSLTTAISNDKNVTINRLNDVTIVTTRDRNTGKSHDRDICRGFAVWEVAEFEYIRGFAILPEGSRR